MMDDLFKQKELLGFFLSGHPLELYKDILVQMGALPLSEFARFQIGMFFRTAFLVDEVKIRFASKTQKKFAIITISDASGERFELPIWPDLFEEKGHLLLENRLIAAILQVEEDKLSCKWFEDLSGLNKEGIEQCDRVFDRVKEQQKFRESKVMTEKPKKEVPVSSSLNLTLSLEKMSNERNSEDERIISFFSRDKAPVEFSL